MILVKYNKIRPNERRPPGSQSSKNSSEDDKNVNKKKMGIFGECPSPKSSKLTTEDDIKVLLVREKEHNDIKVLVAREKEYSWIVKTEKVPSGESLLKLFGKILFETAADSVNFFCFREIFII